MKADNWLLATREKNSLEEEEEDDEKNKLHRCGEKEQIKLREKQAARTLRILSSRETESDPVGPDPASGI